MDFKEPIEKPTEATPKIKRPRRTRGGCPPGSITRPPMPENPNLNVIKSRNPNNDER